MSIAIEDLKLDSLTVEERLDLIEAIWDSLPRAVSPREVPPWHLEILEQRLANSEASPGVGKPWREVLDSL